MTTDRHDFVSGYYIFSAFPRGDDVSAYAHFLNCCEKLGIPDVTEQLQQMMILDYLICNQDRHFGNFGAIRELCIRDRFNTMLFYCDSVDNDTLLKRLETFQNYNISGLVVGGFGPNALRDDVCMYLRAANVPVVLLERSPECRGVNRVPVSYTHLTQSA